MEESIIKTLEYFGPQTAWQIHKWLIKTKASLVQVDKALTRLIKKGKVRQSNGIFHLKGVRQKQAGIKKQPLLAEKKLQLIALLPQSLLVGVYKNWAVVVTDSQILVKFLNLDKDILVLNYSSLALEDKTIDLAKNVLKMKILLSKGKTYQKFLTKNNWLFDCFPNWITSQK